MAQIYFHTHAFKYEWLTKCILTSSKYNNYEYWIEQMLICVFFCPPNIWPSSFTSQFFLWFLWWLINWSSIHNFEVRVKVLKWTFFVKVFLRIDNCSRCFRGTASPPIRPSLISVMAAVKNQRSSDSPLADWAYLFLLSELKVNAFNPLYAFPCDLVSITYVILFVFTMWCPLLKAGLQNWAQHSQSRCNTL